MSQVCLQFVNVVFPDHTHYFRQCCICLACDSGSVEGEDHLALSCVAYETSHKDFLSKLHSISNIKVSPSMLNSVILERIFNSKNPIVLRMLVKFMCTSFKVRKRVKIRNRYNQAPHQTQDTNRKVTSQLDITNESQEVSPFTAGGHKASTNRSA